MATNFKNSFIFISQIISFYLDKHFSNIIGAESSKRWIADYWSRFKPLQTNHRQMGTKGKTKIKTQLSLIPWGEFGLAEFIQ